MSTNDRYTVTIDGRMGPAMLHALSLARSTARLCSGPEVMAEFDRLRRELLDQLGVPGLLRGVDEHLWFRACEALRGARRYHWHTVVGRRDVNGTSLVVDDVEYPLKYGFEETSPDAVAIMGFVERYAHVGAVKGESVRSWDRHCTQAPSREDASSRTEDGSGPDPGMPIP